MGKGKTGFWGGYTELNPPTDTESFPLLPMMIFSHRVDADTAAAVLLLSLLPLLLGGCTTLEVVVDIDNGSSPLALALSLSLSFSWKGNGTDVRWAVTILAEGEG